MTFYLLVTCEHGGNRIPAPYRHLFAGYRSLLQTHRGYDAGALVMATELAAEFGAPLVASTVSRLLIDLNRSIGHPNLYSDASRAAPADVRERIQALHYRPYRTEVEQRVERGIENGKRVIHISSHSFTPELNGRVRTADIGLLYDPRRPGEVKLCERWKASLQTCAPELRVRRNYPYRGEGDGLTSYLRRRFPPGAYVGVELEINQQHVRSAARDWSAVRASIVASMRDALALGSAETSV